MLKKVMSTTEFRATGRYIATLSSHVPADVSKTFHDSCGLKYASIRDGLNPGALGSIQGAVVHFPNLGIVLINGDDDQVTSVRAVATSVEEEGIMFLTPEGDQETSDCRRDEFEVTWGVADTRVTRSAATGARIRAGILDSGIEIDHPAFQRGFAVGQFQARSFLGDQMVRDDVGHGCHCAGILFGDGLTPGHQRFGVAPDVEAFVGRVFVEDKIPGLCGADDSMVFSALEWALEMKCAVVSMSFGRTPSCQRKFSPAYEALARRALLQGTLLVAAAGNDSRRFDNIINPVHEPANCPSIMAVGAVNKCGRLVFSSNGGPKRGPGRIDICGPGAAINSAWRGGSFKHEGGTSAATPFVAGVAALYAQSGLRGKALWRKLLKTASELPNESSHDVGAGLVKAP